MVAPTFAKAPFHGLPALGAGAFLKRVIKETSKKYKVQNKILIAGYSRGGQLTHRFALTNPEMVQAAAAFSPGSWTTPEGDFMDSSMGFIAHENIPDVFSDPDTRYKKEQAEAAGIPASDKASHIPFLVMCGTKDKRVDHAKQFARILRENGNPIEVEWPATDHPNKPELADEFAKYSSRAMEFFKRMTGSLSARIEHIQHAGHDRQYLVYLPRNYDPEKRYWPLVQAKRRQNRFESIHSLIMQEEIDKIGFDAILIVPILGTTDAIPAFPSLGEGAFLKHALKDAQTKFRLHDKIFLTGYSGGAQFTHRFAFQNHELIKAAAPSAPRSWTTPEGRYLEFGLKSGQKSMLDLIGESVVRPAHLKAVSGAEAIPFLVMCGEVDPRLETCKEFVQILQIQGYKVETNWPVNVGHGAGPNAPKEEVRKFSTVPVNFFKRISTN